MNRIVIDAQIPYIEGVFEPFFDEVLYVSGSQFTPSIVRTAEALIIRTRTRVDEALLDGSAVRAVATATIGLDHIDTQWCATHGVEVFSAAGCNARAVAQWVMAAVRELGFTSGTIGIVGVGNVGREVEAMARARGLNVLLNDPVRAEHEGAQGFVPIADLLSASDIITIHTPLDDSTRDMVDAQFLSLMKPSALLLNSSRGEVVVDRDLRNSCLHYALDVWRDEPTIDLKLMRRAAISTPHIAGYSSRGKARATQISVRSVAHFFDIAELFEWQVAQHFELEEPESYDIWIDDQALRAEPDRFEQLRRIR